MNVRTAGQQLNGLRKKVSSLYLSVCNCSLALLNVLVDASHIYALDIDDTNFTAMGEEFQASYPNTKVSSIIIIVTSSADSLYLVTR